MRAYQKRVIFLKNTDSEIFEEAYFVVKPTDGKMQFPKREMTKEVKRIIKESFGRRKVRIKLGEIVAFLLGAALSSLICIAIL